MLVYLDKREPSEDNKGNGQSEETIIGISDRDISSHIKEMRDTDVSHTALSRITDRVIPDVKDMAKLALRSTLLYFMA